jgi:hypothetical protein
MQWQSFLSGQDLDAAKEILCKAFHNFRLGEKGFSFHDLYWDRYYRALSNKVEVVPFLTSARLYLYGLSSQPRAALRAPGLKAAVKLGARALLPRRVMMSLRVRRHSRRVAGDAVGGGVPRGVGDQL